VKDNAFEMGRNQGYTANEIRAQWGKIKADCGAEPTPAMLAAYDADALLAIGVARPLAKAWGGLFVPSGTPKGRKFKPEKARSYTAPEIVGFIVADPKAEGLRAEYMRRTGGAPALLYVNGKLAEAETADRIQRLFERDPVAPFVVIDGAEVTPVGYPEPDAKQDAEDPYQRGVALGQPGDISSRLGVSLAAIPHDTMQAIACAVENDLADASVRDLQRDAEAAKGKSPAEYLADKPLARRAWPTWKKPSLMLARAPRNPPVAGGDVAVSVGRTPPPAGPAPLVVVLGTAAKGWPSIRSALSQLVGAGYIRLWSDNDIQPGEDRRVATQRAYAAATMFVALLNGDTAMPLRDTLQALLGSGRPILPVLTGACLVDLTPVGHLSVLFRDRPYSGDLDGVMLASAVRDMAASLRSVPPAPARLDLITIHDALVSSGLTGSRGALLAGIPRAFVSSLPKNMPDDSSQALVDLGALEQAGTIRDGSRPLVTYLRAAVALAEPRREAQVFRDALRGLGES
jgi:hypothetical protein